MLGYCQKEAKGHEISVRSSRNQSIVAVPVRCNCFQELFLQILAWMMEKTTIKVLPIWLRVFKSPTMLHVSVVVNR